MGGWAGQSVGAGQGPKPPPPLPESRGSFSNWLAPEAHPTPVEPFRPATPTHLWSDARPARVCGVGLSLCPLPPPPADPPPFPPFATPAHATAGLRQRFGNTTEVVAVHVRTGDRATKKNWLVPTTAYLVSAVQHFQRMLPRAVFVVFTDCPSYPALQDLLAYNATWHVHNGSSLQALATMTMCDRLILTTGSFGWWAAYLGTTAMQPRNPPHNPCAILQPPVQPRTCSTQAAHPGGEATPRVLGRQLPLPPPPTTPNHPT